MIKIFLRKIFFPLPEDQEKQGFRPNKYIKLLRSLSNILIVLLRLSGRNRFSNEFIQMLNPIIEAQLPNGESLNFRSGHGRLFWRAKTFLDEEPMLINWINNFEKDDIFYDIGANVGSYSLYAAKRCIKTYSFEPELLNISLLYENIFLNNLEDFCVPMPFALGDKDEMNFFCLKSISKGDALHAIGRRSYMLDSDYADTKNLAVPVFSLDTLVDLLNLPKPTKIKIDVDSNELQIILGAKETISSANSLHIELDLDNDEHVVAYKNITEMGFVESDKEIVDRQWSSNMSNYIFERIKNA